MKKIYFFVYLIMCSFLLAQDLRVSRDSLQFGIGSTINSDKLIDSITITNIGTKLLVIDTIYSKMHYGYPLVAISNVTSTPFFIYDPTHLINVTINPNDSVKFIFSKPDLCPVCSGSSLKPFKDTIFVHSNSMNKPKLKLSSKGYGTTSIEETDVFIENYSLNQNYPNPFNPSTTIKYSIPVETRHSANGGSSLQHVTLKVYDLLGREIATLVDEQKLPGSYTVNFSVETLRATSLPSEIYFYTLTTAQGMITKKMILMK